MYMRNPPVYGNSHMASFMFRLLPLGFSDSVGPHLA